MAFDEETIKEIKWCNLIYHVLRGDSQKKLSVPTQSTEQVAHYLESQTDIKERLSNNNHYLGGHRIETLVEHRTLEGALNLYLEREVFKVDEFIHPARLVIHRLSVPDYLQCLDAKLDLAKAHLARIGAMHGHRTRISITQEMKQILGDLKSLLGYSVHKTPHTRFSDPRASWRNQLIPRDPNPNPSEPPQRQGRRGQTFNDQMDVYMVGLVARLSDDRGKRVPWQQVFTRFNRRYENIATKHQVQDRHKTLERNGRTQAILNSF